MARTIYEPATKAAIVHATVSAKAEGKSWNEAHEAAKAAGYTGSQKGLVQFIRGTQGKRGKAKSAKAENGAAPKAKRGRKAKKAGKATGKRFRYDAASKAAILQATVAARKAGKKWAEAHEAAAAAGYKGGVPALKILLSKAGKTPKKRGRPAKAKGSASAKKRAAAPVTKVAGNLEELINREIKSRVDAAIQGAIAQLQKLIS